MLSHEVAKKAAQEGNKLMKARADFKLLQQEEEKYLKDREVKAQSLLQTVHKQIQSAEKVLDAIRDKTINKITAIRGKVDELIEGLVSILDRAEKIFETAEAIKEKNENVEQQLDETYNLHVDKIKEVGEFEKELKQREKEVELKDERVSAKLTKIRDIRFWHKHGGKITDDIK